MLKLGSISINLLPIELYIHNAINTSQMVTLKKIIEKGQFQAADRYIARLTGAKMNYDANYWSDVTKETSVIVEIADMVNTENAGGSVCKSIW